MDLLDDANIAPHTAITFGELEEHIEDDSSQIPLLTPSVQDYLGDFDPHHYSPDTTDISIEQPIEEQQTIDETTEKITAIDESIDIGDIDVGPMDVSMEIPQRTQITDIFEGGEISSQIVEVEEDDEQKNADKNDLVKSHKPRTIVIRPDKTSILSQRFLFNLILLLFIIIIIIIIIIIVITIIIIIIIIIIIMIIVINYL